VNRSVNIWARLDKTTIVIFLLLVIIGWFNIYAAVYNEEHSRIIDLSQRYGKQFVWILATFVIAVFVVVTDSRFYSFFAYFIYGFFLFLLLLVLFVGENIHGARSWFQFGSFSLQPSEIWKPVMVLYLASFLEKRKERLVESGLVALPAIVLVIISAVLIFLQQDFSTSILVLAIAFAMLYLAGTPFLFMSNLALFLILYGALMIFSSQYRVQRLVGFLMPEQHTQTVNYQMYSALRAIRSGGVWGKGVGLGTLKISSIPEVQSDFIFAAFVEESGFAGVLVVMGLWSFILIRAGRILIGSDYFSRLAGFGMITLLSLQVLLNLAVVTGVMPTTGLALPFFSAGGSALLMSAISCGILINLSRSGQTETGMRAALRKEGAAYD